jgi:hypothetical protein
MFTGAHVCKTVIPAGWGATHNGTPTWDDVYPGAGYIDLIGFDPYNTYASTLGSQWLEFGDLQPLYFPALSAWAASKGIRWGIAETGWTDAAFAAGTVPNYGDATLWYQRVFNNMLAYGGVALVYFPYTGAANSWHFQGKPAKIAAVSAVQQQSALYPF